MVDNCLESSRHVPVLFIFSSTLIFAVAYEKQSRGGSRTAATSKAELFVIIDVNWKPLTIITKCSILDVAVALDPPLLSNI